MISPNVIIIWPGTNASIPAGFSRETALDGRYPKATAAGVNPNVNGGAATHTHSSSAHSHAAVAHRHYGQTSRDGAFETEGGSFSAARDAHVHDWDYTNVTSGALSDAVTYAATSSDPPYYTVIFIKSIGYSFVPPNAVVLWNSATLPTDFNLCDGGGAPARPDMRNKYLVGAATGANGGSTGGTLNHEHSINHTHSAVTHTHSGGSGWDSDQNSSIHRDNWAGGGPAVDHHTHTIYLSANSAETASAYSGNAGSADTVEPAYKKLVAIQNNGANAIPKNIIGMWLGTLASIPIGWNLCDGTKGTPDMRDKFLKIANTTGEIGDTGGSNTHTHAASNSHTHTIASTHSHSGYSDYQSDPNSTTTANSNGVSKDHSHPTTSCSTATSSWSAATVTAASSDGQPLFQTVAYIQYEFGAGGSILNLLL